MLVMANTLDAKTRLSALIERALQGDEVVIARDGVPCVRLMPMPLARDGRAGGEFRGRIHGDFTGPIGDDAAGGWG